jgi:hypothetical protein
VVVRLIWRECNYRCGEWNTLPKIDSFWVEAAEQEAHEKLFPLLTPGQVAESKELSKREPEAPATLKPPPLPYCFLVARDLSSIDPHESSYPYHHMWNAYTPFEEIRERHIDNLHELRELVAPAGETARQGDGFPDEIRGFIEDMEWIFAKTYATTWPHEYLVKAKVNPHRFAAMVSHIRAHGYQGSFYKKPIGYFDEAGFVYWTMGGPIEECDIVNRCPKEDSYEYRAERGDLPGDRRRGAAGSQAKGSNR